MADKPDTQLSEDGNPLTVVVRWTVKLKGQAKRAMRPGNLQPEVREVAERGLAAIQVNPRSGRPLTNDPRWVWDDKVNVPEFRLVYEFDESTAEVMVRYIGERGPVPY